MNATPALMFDGQNTGLVPVPESVIPGTGFATMYVRPEKLTEVDTRPMPTTAAEWLDALPAIRCGYSGREFTQPLFGMSLLDMRRFKALKAMHAASQDFRNEVALELNSRRNIKRRGFLLDLADDFPDFVKLTGTRAKDPAEVTIKAMWTFKPTASRTADERRGELYALALIRLEQMIDAGMLVAKAMRDMAASGQRGGAVEGFASVIGGATFDLCNARYTDRISEQFSAEWDEGGEDQAAAEREAATKRAKAAAGKRWGKRRKPTRNLKRAA